MLTVELKCRTPDGKVVTAWKQSKPIVDLHRVRQDQPVFRKFLSKGTNDFFKQFVERCSSSPFQDPIEVAGPHSPSFVVPASAGPSAYSPSGE